LTGPTTARLQSETNTRTEYVYRYVIKKFLRETAAVTTKQKEEKRKKPKPEEQESMPQHQHCPHAKHRGDRNRKNHEEQQKVVA
jgi:hypothetical protein